MELTERLWYEIVGNPRAPSCVTRPGVGRVGFGDRLRSIQPARRPPVTRTHMGARDQGAGMGPTGPAS